VARNLRNHGFDARALEGGYTAWKRTYAVEPIPAPAV
jgi:rhodanese-related sulfurtransferase